MTIPITFRFREAVAMVSLLSFLTPAIALAAPSIGSITPNSHLIAGVSITLSASVSSAVPIQSCNLYIDSEDKGAMTVSGGTASKANTFPYARVYTAFVFCRDTSNGIASGPNTSINVTQGPTAPSSPPLSGGTGSPPPEKPVEPAPEEPEGLAAGSLVTLACPEDAAPDHICKAVYYFGADERRHGFPNSKIYFTWYESFDSVVTVESAELAAIPLGLNVTYRPGVKLVKFETLHAVYAVSKGGELRWIATEEIASALYGNDWNTKVDDIPDVFFTNYTFGEPIESANDYSIVAEMEAASTIDDSL